MKTLPNTITHLTLNDGAVVVSHRDEFDTMDRIDGPPLVAEFIAYECGGAACVYGPRRDGSPASIVGVAWDERGANHIWQMLVEAARKLGVRRNRNIRKPKQLPWCVSVRAARGPL